MNHKLKQPKTVYVLQTYVGGAWRTQETFDSAVRAVARYGNTAGRKRVLQTWFDASQRQHDTVLRDSDIDARINAATECSPPRRGR